MNEVHLLQLIRSYKIGGAERSTITYSNQLTHYVASVSIFAQKGKFNYSNIINKNVKIFYSAGKISNPLTFLLNIILLIRIILIHKINVVNYHQRVYIPFILILRHIFPRIKFLYTHHNVFNDRLNNFIIADKYIAISNSVKKDLEKYSKSPIYIIKHGIEIIASPYTVKNKIKNFGYVGRFYKTKGIFILLQAFKEVTKTYSDINLFFIGEGEEKKGIYKFIKQNELEKNIYIKEPEFNLKEIYSDLDCLILPSEKHEGFGLVLIEAIIWRIPVISSDLESFKEFLIHDKTGLLFENGNVDSLTKQIIRLYKNNDLRERLIKNSFEFIKENYSMESYIQNILEILNNVSIDKLRKK